MRSEEAKSVLVTGATGFIGYRLCERLKEDGHQVIALGRKVCEGPWDRFIECDLCESPPPVDAMEGVSLVYHLASKAHAFGKDSSGEEYESVIVGGTEKLVQLARASGVERFIYMSSVKAMGEGNPEGLPVAPIDEDCPCQPQSPYGVAKFRAEQEVLQAGFPHAVVLRPTMVYGPGGKGNLQRMREAVRKGRFPPIPENGNRRSMIHLDDLMEFVLRSAMEPLASGKTYILALEVFSSSTRPHYLKAPPPRACHWATTRHW